LYYKELKKILENKIAPKKYKKKAEFYGLQYGNINDNNLIKKVMITLDLSLDAIHYAIKNKVNLIISPHPLLEKPIFNFDKLLTNKLNLLSRYPLSIYVLNSSFNSSEYGVSQTIANMLYLKVEKIFEIENENGVEVPIGRICSPKQYLKEGKKFNLKDLLQRFARNYKLEIVQYSGKLQKEIKKICIVAGNKSKKDYFKKSLNNNCDCYISSNLSHEIAVFAKDVGLALINMPHCSVEFHTIKKLYNFLSLEFPFDNFLLYESPNPYDYYKL
jgi:dinuclear metal center YbgI/SA1388 family protein